MFARAVDAYNTRLYVEWEQRVGAIATEKLKQPILYAQATTKARDETPESAAAKEAGSAHMNPAKIGKVSVNHQATGIAECKPGSMPPPPYGVNFAMELRMIIRESKYLDRMGFQVTLCMCLVFSRVFGCGDKILILWNALACSRGRGWFAVLCVIPSSSNDSYLSAGTYQRLLGGCHLTAYVPLKPYHQTRGQAFSPGT